MSEFSLNLLPSQAKFQARKMRLKLRVKQGMGVFLGIWLVVTAVMMVVFWLTKRGVESANKKKMTADRGYRSVAEVAVVNEKLKYQAKMVGKVLAERYEYASSMKKINRLLVGEGVKVTAMEMKEKGLFRVSGRARNSAMDEVEKRIKEIVGGGSEDFVTARLLSLSWKNNEWFFVVEAKTK